MIGRHSLLPLLVLAAALRPLHTTAAGDGAAGKAAFSRCAACHSLAPGINGVGPSLNGVVGRRIASAPAFSYTDALPKTGITWTQAGLDKFLANPGALYPGTRMNIRVADPQTRSDLIAYLKSQGSERP